MGHTTAPNVAAKLQDARSRGGRTTATRRQRERAERLRERTDLSSPGAIQVFLGIASHLMLTSRDSSIGASASKIADQAIALLEVPRLRARVRELEEFIAEKHPEAVRR